MHMKQTASKKQVQHSLANVVAHCQKYSRWSSGTSRLPAVLELCLSQFAA
jgi:hypothetical protein